MNFIDCLDLKIALCLFNAFLAQIKYDGENCEKKYGLVYLRCQALLHYLKEKELLDKVVIDGVRHNYGWHTQDEGEEQATGENGPFQCWNMYSI